MTQKRPRVDGVNGGEDDSDLAIREAQEVLAALRSLHEGMPEGFLWNTSMRQKLLQPTAYYAEKSSEEYFYIGRSRAQALLKAMQDLKPDSELLVQGARGSGKRTAVCSLVGYMLNQGEKVVYLCASRFIKAPLEVMRHALLVATGCDKSVARLRQLDQIKAWCSMHRRDRLLFVVDDWDKFEESPEEKKVLLALVSGYHNKLVKVSSSSSREKGIFTASDKPLPTFEFDGPYTLEELQTWIAHSNLSPARLEALDCLTGGMPGLLQFYEEVKGNARLYMDKIEFSYTRKLSDKLIRLQTNKEQLGAAVEMITTGMWGTHLVTPVDLTCFYKDRNKFKLLSPYLRTRAEYYLMKQRKTLQSDLDYTAVQTWAAAVRADCIRTGRGRNPARAGWNVEGLILAVMQYQGKLWNDLRFTHCKTYEHGGEAALLRILTTEELSQGLLAVPVALNEKAVDVVYLKLDSGGILTVKAVQITIAKWKHRKRKRSYKVWQEKILPKWMSEEWSVQHQFVYVMPQKLNREELEDVNKDLSSYITACHAAVDTDGKEDEEDGIAELGADGNEEDGEEDAGDYAYLDAEYGTEDCDADLNEVTSLPTEFKILGDVHPCLAEFDRFLNFKDEDKPAPLQKEQVRQCGGQVCENGIRRQCLRWSRTKEDVYYCCAAHEQAVVSP